MRGAIVRLETLIFFGWLHCKYFSRNISGFYACVIIGCIMFVVFTTISWAQPKDVVPQCIHLFVVLLTAMR